jgi:hypothetical protein
MAFVRTISFTLPREDANEIRPGNPVYNGLVGGSKYIAQFTSGLIQTGVWRSAQAGGSILFTMFTEWSSIEELQAYANQDTIKEVETLLHGTTPVTVNVYEVIG